MNPADVSLFVNIERAAFGSPVLLVGDVGCEGMMERPKVEQVPARNALPAGCSYRPGFGGGAVDGTEVDYVYVPELGDWFLADRIPPIPPKGCPIVKQNGHPCSGNKTRTGVCLGHSNQVASIVAHLLRP